MFAFSHSPIPAACDDCHLASQPTAIVNNMVPTPIRVSGIASPVTHPARESPGLAEPTPTNPCPAPVPNVTPHSVRPLCEGFSHDAGGMGDCASCHLQRRSHLERRVFLAQPDSRHVPRAATRATGQQGRSARHRGRSRGGQWSRTGRLQELSHRAVAGQPPRKTGAGEPTADHDPHPTPASSVTWAKRPVDPVGNAAVRSRPTGGGTGDCVSCHLRHDRESEQTGAAGQLLPRPDSHLVQRMSCR